MLQFKSRIERRLAAILSADIKAYSTLMLADEELMHRRVGEEIGRLVKQLDEFGGRVFSNAGDGLMAEFPSANAAIRAALRFQDASARRNQNLSQPHKIQFRIGIHLGDIVVEDGRVGGTSVNIAARLEQLAEPGGIFISGAVHEQIKRTIPLDYEYVAEALLKNIPGAVPVYRVGKPEEPIAAMQQRLSNRAPLPLPIGPSIAVLPFSNLGEPAASYLCDGIVEDIITGLSKFKNLFVIGRYSSFRYRGRQVDTRRIAEELGVRYLLQGSVRRSERRIRITAQLVDGLRGQVLWADQFDDDLVELFDIQNDLIQMIVVRLAVRLEGIERDRLRHIEKSDLAAYGHLLHGQEFAWHLKRRSNISARALFAKASASDPGYARAYAALSRTYNWEWRFSWTAQRGAALDQALELAKRSLSLDNTDPRAHSELGFAYLYKKERELAILSYQDALRLNPNDADVMAELADAYAYDDQLDQSVALLNRAMRLNPFYPDWYLWYLADALFGLERYEDAITAVRRMKDPAQGHRLAAASFAHLGRINEARGHAQKVLARHPDFSVAQWAEVPPEKIPERLDRLVSGLRMAGLPD